MKRLPFVVLFIKCDQKERSAVFLIRRDLFMKHPHTQSGIHGST